jgi:hypothetical protein
MLCHTELQIDLIMYKLYRDTTNQKRILSSKIFFPHTFCCFDGISFENSKNDNAKLVNVFRCFYDLE